MQNVTSPKKTTSAAFRTGKFATHLTLSVLKPKLDLMKTFIDFHFGETSPIS